MKKKLFDPYDVDGLLGGVPAAGARHADDRRDVGVVAAVPDGDVVGPASMALVGSNSIPTGMLAAPDADPRMDGVRPFEPRLALGRILARRNPDT